MSEVVRSQDFGRYAWITFSTEADAEAALTALAEKKINDYSLKPTKNEAPTLPHKTTPALSTGATALDLETSKKLIERFDKVAEIETNPLLALEKPEKVKLSLQILYLRRVHSFDFHSAEQFDDERLLSAKHGPITLRTEGDFEKASQYESDYTNKINDLLSEEAEELCDPSEAEDVKEEIEHYLKKKVQEVGNERFACLICNKNFKASHFVEKHVSNKHIDKV